MKYRIITDGKKFRVEFKGLFGFWTVFTRTEMDRAGEIEVPCEFDSKEEAENFIKDNQRSEWRVVSEVEV